MMKEAGCSRGPLPYYFTLIVYNYFTITFP